MDFALVNPFFPRILKSDLRTGGMRTGRPRSQPAILAPADGTSAIPACDPGAYGREVCGRDVRDPSLRSWRLRTGRPRSQPAIPVCGRDVRDPSLRSRFADGRFADGTSAIPTSAIPACYPGAYGREVCREHREHRDKKFCNGSAPHRLATAGLCRPYGRSRPESGTVATQSFGGIDCFVPWGPISLKLWVMRFWGNGLPFYA